MVRLRIQYEKAGATRFVSHRDTMRILRRVFASARVPVCFSKGYNPHPRLSFGPSLRTGWEGRSECLDAILERPCPDLEPKCNSLLPDGLRVVDTAFVADDVPKLSTDVTAARYTVWISREDCPPEEAQRFESEIRERFGGVEVSAGAPERAAGAELIEIEAHGTGDGIDIEYLSTMSNGKSLFPEELLGPALGDVVALRVPLRVVRTALYVERGGRYVSPISKGVVQDRS